VNRNILANSNLNKETQHLKLSVYTTATIKLKEILSDKKPVGKLFPKISELYFFLFWMSRNNIFHVRRDSLAEMIYSRHEDRLRKAMRILEEHSLIKCNNRFNPRTQRPYYTYRVYSFDFENSSSTISIEYNLPDLISKIVFRKTKYHVVCSDDDNIPSSSNSSSPIYSHTDSLLDTEERTFCQQFIRWYDELSFEDGSVYPNAHFSEKDGRLYHQFHQISKEERENNVYWDGEHVIEAWDAHSAFFTVLCFFLKFYQKYDKIESHKRFTEEANRMLDLTLSDNLYSSVADYHNSKSNDFLSRKRAKELIQMYKNLSYSYLFKMKKGKIIDGDIKKYWWSVQYKYIDEYFRINFPCIRSLFLSYPRHPELKKCDFYRKDGSKGSRMKWKYISDLQQNMLPYEFKLISLGLCKDLLTRYGIKSITVHDAIYMRKSDARRIASSDIDELLAQRLEKSNKVSRSKALF